MSSFFNCLLLAVCVGGAVSLTLVVWIQDNRGWDWGFGVSTVAIFLAMVIFAAGLPQYRLQVVQGTSAIIEIIQVCICDHLLHLKVGKYCESKYDLCSFVVFRFMLQPFGTGNCNFQKTPGIFMRITRTKKLL